jgi:hypothetical protein
MRYWLTPLTVNPLMLMVALQMIDALCTKSSQLQRRTMPNVTFLPLLLLPCTADDRRPVHQDTASCSAGQRCVAAR